VRLVSFAKSWLAALIIVYLHALAWIYFMPANLENSTLAYFLQFSIRSRSKQ
jgi:hypothetical protein